MADISILSRLVGAYNRNVDLSKNALVVGSLKIGEISPVELTKAIAEKLIAMQGKADADGTYDTSYHTKTILASVDAGEGASLVGIEDAGGFYAGSSVEDALQELGSAVGTGLATDISYSNATSGLVATNVQTAIDEVEARVDATEIVANAAIPASQKGVANGVASIDANGFVPISQIPPAAIERLVIVADEVARFSLTIATVQNGDTVKQVDTDVMYYVKDEDNLDSALGYEVYSAGTASAVEFSGILNLPNTLAGYGILDDSDSISEGAVNLYFTDERAQDAVASSLNNTSTIEFTYDGLNRKLEADVIANSIGKLEANETIADQSTIVGGNDVALKVSRAPQLATIEVAGEILEASTLLAVRFSRSSDAGFVAGSMLKADNDSSLADNFDVQGLCYEGAQVEDTESFKMISEGEISVMAHGLDIGEPIFLGASGAITQTPPGIGYATVKLGTVKDANIIRVKIQIVTGG